MGGFGLGLCLGVTLAALPVPPVPATRPPAQLDPAVERDLELVASWLDALAQQVVVHYSRKVTVPLLLTAGLTALYEKADLVVRRGGEGQQRRRSQLVQVDLAVDVGEEVHGDARADSFFVAEQENVLELGEPGAVDGEDDFVDHLLAQDFPQGGDGEDRVFGFEADARRRAGAGPAVLGRGSVSAGATSHSPAAHRKSAAAKPECPAIRTVRSEAGLKRSERATAAVAGTARTVVASAPQSE